MIEDEFGSNNAKESLCAGINYFLDGNYKNAELSFKKAIEEDETLSLAYCYLGIVSLELNDSIGAEQWCEMGLTFDPDDSYLHYCYGVALEKNNKLIEAKHEYDVYLGSCPEDVECWFNLGNVHSLLNDLEDALFCFDKVIELEPWSYKSLYNKAVLLIDMEREDEAISLLETTVYKSPMYWKAWVKLGMIYSKRMEWCKAANAYEQVIRLQPKLSDGFYNLGICYLSLNNITKALEAFNKSVRLNPSDADALFYVGMSHLGLDSKDYAVQAFNQVLGIDLEHEKTHYMLGCLHFLNGDVESANKEAVFLQSINSKFVNMLHQSLCSQNEING